MSDTTAKTEIESAALLSVGETAKLLSVSERTVRRLVHRGELPGLRVGGQWRISRHALPHTAQPNLGDDR